MSTERDAFRVVPWLNRAAEREAENARLRCYECDSGFPGHYGGCSRAEGDRLAFRRIAAPTETLRLLMLARDYVNGDFSNPELAEEIDRHIAAETPVTPTQEGTL